MPGIAAGLLLTAAGAAITHTNRHNASSHESGNEADAVVKAGRKLSVGAHAVGRIADHAALAAYAAALAALTGAVALQQWADASAHEMLLRKSISYTILAGAVATAITLSGLLPTEALRPRRWPTTLANYATIALLTAGIIAGQWWSMTGGITIMTSAAVGAAGAAMSIWWVKPTKPAKPDENNPSADETETTPAKAAG
jgi:hypothetical protein